LIRDRAVVAAEYNFCFRKESANVSYNLGNTRIPVGHHRLDEDEIESILVFKEVQKYRSWQAEPPKVPRDLFKAGWIWNLFTIESASAPPVGFKFLLLHYEGMQPVQVIEQLKIGLVPQISRNAKQPIRL